MAGKISPLAPKSWPEMPAIEGIRLGSIEAGIKYKNRMDLTAIVFDEPAETAGVFTKSLCPSAPVDWCRKQLKRGKARAVIINSGNANAFTGKRGLETTLATAKAAAAIFKCKQSEVFLASTGVIGEPLEPAKFVSKLELAGEAATADGWTEAAKAIMTTDTYHKMATRTFKVDRKSYHINGIAKGSGMIAPDMATMLSFLVTDYPVAASLLQRCLSEAVLPSFNSISVDSDTSTSDTVMLFSVPNGRKPVKSGTATGVDKFKRALGEVLHELAMHVVRDGEGASKHIEISVKGAKSDKSARIIAFSIANSPLVKTAISGEDANWGRIVMAVGKAGQLADRDKLAIWFDKIRVAYKGERDKKYDEEAASAVVKRDFIPITVDIGLGNGRAKVWTCDLTHEYIAINADYRT